MSSACIAILFKAKPPVFGACFLTDVCVYFLLCLQLLCPFNSLHCTVWVGQPAAASELHVWSGCWAVCVHMTVCLLPTLSLLS